MVRGEIVPRQWCWSCLWTRHHCGWSFILLGLSMLGESLSKEGQGSGLVGRKISSVDLSSQRKYQICGG